MAIEKYVGASGKTLWRVDEWFDTPSGQVRIRRRRMPTKDLAEMWAAKKRVEAFEGAALGKRARSEEMTVADLVSRVLPVAAANTRYLQTGTRAGKDKLAHALRHLGKLRVKELTAGRLVAYRELRNTELTRFGRPPAPAQVNVELAVLRRMVNVAVEMELIERNPVRRWPVLRLDNARRRLISDEEFSALLSAADDEFKAVLFLARTSGMRHREIAGLRWSQVDMKQGCIRLESGDTKTHKPRLIPMAPAVVEAFRRLPRALHVDRVFVGPKGAPRSEFVMQWQRACAKAGIVGAWFHDLRRTFCTSARRAGLSEGVIMSITGHKTREIFSRYDIREESDVRHAVGVVAANLGQVLGKAAEKAV